MNDVIVCCGRGEAGPAQVERIQDRLLDVVLIGLASHGFDDEAQNGIPHVGIGWGRIRWEYGMALAVFGEEG